MTRAAVSGNGRRCRGSIGPVEIPFQPLEPLDALGAVVGAAPGRLLALREDRIGTGGGGNKVRKAERAVGRAAADGLRRVVTTGAPQSNHARAVAIAAARYGIACLLVLEGARPPQRLGNLLLEDLAGAEVHWSGERAPDGLASELASDGHTRLIPFGGSDRDAVEVYAEVGADLLARVPDVDHVVVAVGSGATAAGLVRALGAERVHCVDTGAVDDPQSVLRHLLDDPDAALRIDRSQVGSGYEHLQPAVVEAVRRFLRTDGILLDATYAGRAAASMVEQYRAGAFAADDSVVFVHTGGVPGLFGHPELVR